MTENKGDLISREALIKAISELPNDNPSYYYTGYFLDREKVIEEIDNAPTVEERSYEQGFRDGYAQCITDNEERKESNRLFQKGGLINFDEPCYKFQFVIK